MFGFNKEKWCAHATGKLISIDQVPDPVFSQKMMGDGYAIEVEGEAIYAPTDGEVTMIFPTKHALGFKTKKGTEILIHIGLDTVSLNGEGFTVHCNVGDKVKAGDKIVSIDYDLFRRQEINLVTPVVFTENTSFILNGVGNAVEACDILEIKVK
ncbi:MAG: PTS glucose transporter subunit IIA [Erysipelothrix sp.]